MVTTNAERRYLPAAGRDAFLPLYDPFTKLFGIDGLRMALLEQAALQPHHRVLAHPLGSSDEGQRGGANCRAHD